MYRVLTNSSPSDKFVGSCSSRREHAFLSDPQIQRSVKDIIIHENYHYPSHKNDIAVVRLSSPVLYTSNIRRACLPETSYAFPSNSDVVVTGWGTLKTDGEFLNFYHYMVRVLGV